MNIPRFFISFLRIQLVFETPFIIMSSSNEESSPASVQPFHQTLEPEMLSYHQSRAEEEFPDDHVVMVLKKYALKNKIESLFFLDKGQRYIWGKGNASRIQMVYLRLRTNIQKKYDILSWKV